jgi:hypothetical protein
MEEFHKGNEFRCHVLFRLVEEGTYLPTGNANLHTGSRSRQKTLDRAPGVRGWAVGGEELDRKLPSVRKRCNR